VGCTSTVSSGSSQSSYECAEFVARSLAAGGYIKGLSGLESQSKYDPYTYNGNSYDLLWVSDKQVKSRALEGVCVYFKILVFVFKFLSNTSKQ
jgi:hypothetical protein